MLGIDLALNILSAAMLAFVSAKYDFVKFCYLNNNRRQWILLSQEAPLIILLKGSLPKILKLY